MGAPPPPGLFAALHGEPTVRKGARQSGRGRGTPLVWHRNKAGAAQSFVFSSFCSASRGAPLLLCDATNAYTACYFSNQTSKSKRRAIRENQAHTTTMEKENITNAGGAWASPPRSPSSRKSYLAALMTNSPLSAKQQFSQSSSAPTPTTPVHLRCRWPSVKAEKVRPNPCPTPFPTPYV